MVNIPTSREQDYVNPRSGRIAPSGVSVSVGDGLANLGQGIVKAAYDLNDLKTAEAADVMKAKGNDVSTALTNFMDAEEKTFNESRDKSSESGIGFTRSYMEGYEKRANDFAKANFEGLDADTQTKYLNTILNNGNTFYSKSFDYETKAKTAFYDRNTNTNLDKIRTRVQSNAAPFDQLKKEGLAAIDAVDMPEPWKAERRAAWDADAAESKWKWKFQQNPKEAIDLLKGRDETGTLLAAIMDTESHNNPGAESSKGASGLMQVMPETGMEIARELGDSNFPVDGTVDEQKAYLKKADVSKAYGEHYFNKMMTRFDGDKEAALIAYNAGPSRADEWLASGRDDSVLPAETKGYYKKVLDKVKADTFTTVEVNDARKFLQSHTGKDASHIDGMQDGFATKLARLMQDAPAGIKEKLGVFSGARSNERQAQLFADAVKRYGSPEAARKWVAPPGHSQHNKGNAADLSYNGDSLAKAPPEVVNWLHQNAAKYGLNFPLNHENWHIEDASARGTKAIPVDPDLEAIPAPRREQLSNWGETELNQRMTLERSQRKDAYSLMIASQPETVDREVILRDATIDDGDKAALINSLNSAMEKTGNINLFLGALAKGNVAVNAFDADQRKVADSAYEKLVGVTAPEQAQALTNDFVERTGYIPKKAQADIRRGMISTNVNEMSAALSNAEQISRVAPSAIAGMEGNTLVEKNLAAYRHYAFDMGFSQDEAARKVIALNDPEKMAQREAILKSDTVKAYVKKVDQSKIAGLFDIAGFSNPALGDAPDQKEIAVGYSPESEAVIVSDYKAMLEESIVDAGGDTDLAEKMTNERFAKIYGTSGLTLAGDASVVKFPPEKTYPADINGSHDYIVTQALEDLKGESIVASEVYLQAYDQTERDIAAGRPPNYQVFYVQDGKLNMYPSPFTFDPAKGNVTAVDQSRNAQKTNLAEQKIFDEIRDARNKATAEFKDYPEVYRAQKMQEAERAVRDKWDNSEGAVKLNEPF